MAKKTPNQRSRDKRPSEKAMFHQITGAGKSHIKREFFGLSDADEQAIEQETGRLIDVNLQREGSA
jgi:hypothetical protein